MKKLYLISKGTPVGFFEKSTSKFSSYLIDEDLTFDEDQMVQHENSINYDYLFADKKGILYVKKTEVTVIK